MVEKTENLPLVKNPESALKADVDDITKGMKGMMQVDNKNVVSDLTSQKQTWTTLGVPENI
jgi:hypothetical protein